MKKLISGLVATMVMVFSLAVFSFAGDVTKSFTLTRQTKVNGQLLKEGDYSVKFADDKEGELTIWRSRKEVARTTYKFQEMDKPAKADIVAYTQNDDGTMTITRLEFKGMKSALVFE
jgi:hypothetical protein